MLSGYERNMESLFTLFYAAARLFSGHVLITSSARFLRVKVSQLMVISALQKRRYKTVKYFTANELSPAGKTRSYQFKVLKISGLC